MTIQKFAWGMRSVLFLGILLTIISIVFLSPYSNPETLQKSFIEIAFFYLSVFLLFVGMFSCLLFRLRRKFHTEEFLETHLGVSARQGFLIALTLITILFLQEMRILIWWDCLLVIGAIFIIELYFLTR